MLAVAYCYLVSVNATLTLHSLHLPIMLAGVQQHPLFSSQTYFDYETFYLLQCISTVFGSRPIFEMHRGMWPGYTFFSFS